MPSILFPLVATVFTTVSLTLGCDESSCKTLITFNAGLSPHVPNYLDRRQEIPTKLLDEDADFVCLQEYWYERDMQLLVSMVNKTYPYHYSMLHSKVGTLKDEADSDNAQMDPKSACSSADNMTHFSTEVRSCAIREGCISATGETTPLTMPCVAYKCMFQLAHAGLTYDCFHCVVTSATNISDLFEWCLPIPGEDNRMNLPALFILSKRPISQAGYHSYEPGVHMTLQRGYLQAQVEDLGLVLCTQMSENLPTYFEENLPYKSYVEQQSHEIETLNSTFECTGHILLGNLNMGPRAVRSDLERNLDGQLPCNFQTLLNTGYHTSYMVDDGRCTFCEHSNPYCFLQNNAVDLVLFKKDNFSYRFSERVMDQLTPHPLSDHYAIKTTVCP